MKNMDAFQAPPSPQLVRDWGDPVGTTKKMTRGENMMSRKYRVRKAGVLRDPGDEVRCCSVYSPMKPAEFRSYRLSLGMSQRAFAEMLGADLQSIQRIESEVPDHRPSARVVAQRKHKSRIRPRRAKRMGRSGALKPIPT